MTPETKQVVRDIVREAIPSVVCGVTCYSQAKGVKYYAIKADEYSSKQLQEKVQHALDNMWLAPDNLKAYVGIIPGTWARVIKIMAGEHKDPGLESFKKVPAERTRRRARQDNEVALVPTIPVPITTLRKWKQTLDHLDHSGAARHTYAGEVRAVVAEMQKILRR